MFIYVLRNRFNGKCYVGQDSGSLHEMRRVSLHFKAGENHANGKPYKHVSKLVPAIAKYGKDAFEVQIHSSGYTSKAELDNAETQLIVELDSIKNGYNIMPGGQGFLPNSQITDDSIRQQMFNLRSKGAKKANANRWSNASEEDKLRWTNQLITGRKNGSWKNSLIEYWKNASNEVRQMRAQQMKNGRPFFFVYTSDCETIQETNLRSLLARIDTQVPKRQIERAVRESGQYACDQFKIEKHGRNK